MNKSNLFLMVLGFIIIAGMYLTNVILKKEYQNIDLIDPYKNYVSIESAPYSVLNISGSNGYPIEVVHKKTNDLKVLRSRLNHFKSTAKNDTLFIQFSGSNIPMEQRNLSNTPPGIIVERVALSSIIITNVHNRVIGFSNQDLTVTLKGNSLIEISNCNLTILEIDMKNNSQVEFLNANTVDFLDLHMANRSIAKLQKVEFETIKHNLSDSVTIVLSKEGFINILK